jgi:CubicO group peptidase (beta-lactamase class C family)
MSGLTDAFNLLGQGVEDGAFPGAVACVGNRDGVMLEKAVGYRQIHPAREPMTVDTRFDLASLTKVVATTPLLFRLVEQGRISLFDPVCEYLDDFKNDQSLRIVNLLTHTSGLTPTRFLFDQCKTEAEALRCISESERVFEVGKDVLYNCFNYFLLKTIIEKVTGESFDVGCERHIFSPLEMADTGFNPKGYNIAATEFDASSETYIKGIVHDENARFLDGVSGNAGVFSTVRDLSKYCAMYLSDGKLPDGKQLFSKNTIHAMTHNYTAHLGDSRGLGFCVKKNGENCSGGELISEGSFGHTGYTGTSLWIDPKIGIYIILLTNRVHPSRENNKIIRFRRLFHNAVIAGL